MTTASTENSGLFANLLPIFEQQSGYTVQFISAGSGNALPLAKAGNVDLNMTHAPEAEQQFITDGFGHLPQEFMAKDRNRTTIWKLKIGWAGHGENPTHGGFIASLYVI